MSLGNYGSVMAQLQGYIATEFGSAPHNQGLSLFPQLVALVASRADLTDTNLRVAAPRLFDGTNDVDVEAGAVHLIGVVVQSLAAQAEDAAVLFYETNTVTEGTTRYVAAVMVNAGGTAATAEAQAVVFAEPIPMTALSWSVVDNGADTDIEGTTLGDASGVRVMVVYSE
jgi:hypothetical protein